jgi:cation diffusion facilitator family transporter
MYYSNISSTKRFSYGYGRLEVISAMLSITLIWILSFSLITEACNRFYNPHPIKPLPMLFMALAGVIVNATLIFVFGHDEHEEFTENRDEKMPLDSCLPAASLPITKPDLNIRAAMLHAIGDLVCSFGVLTSSIIIYVNPSLQYFDPLCTLIFGIIALSTTFTIIKDIFNVIMQATPKQIDVSTLETDLRKVDGHISECKVKVWQVSNEVLVADVKLTVVESISFESYKKIVGNVRVVLEKKYFIKESTIELQNDDCKQKYES